MDAMGESFGQDLMYGMVFRIPPGFGSEFFFNLLLPSSALTAAMCIFHGILNFGPSLFC